MVYLCDFHREQAWETWTSRTEAGLSTKDRSDLLEILRKLAASKEKSLYMACMAELQGSEIYTKNSTVKGYLDGHWLNCKERWIKALRDPRYDSAITTNNGTESLNKLLKYSFLMNAPDKSLSAIITIIIEKFNVSQLKDYSMKNIKHAFKDYNSQIPEYLKGRPEKFVRKCLPSVYSARNDIRDYGRELVFKAEASSGQFEVRAHSRPGYYKIDLTKPSCECWSFAAYHTPCKHMFVLLELDLINWEDLPKKFREQPHFVLDKDVMNKFIHQEVVPEEKDSNDTVHPIRGRVPQFEPGHISNSNNEVPLPLRNSLRRNRYGIVTKLEKIKFTTSEILQF